MAAITPPCSSGFQVIDRIQVKSQDAQPRYSFGRQPLVEGRLSNIILDEVEGTFSQEAHSYGYV
jgi:hypothetical protein